MSNKGQGWQIPKVVACALAGGSDALVQQVRQARAAGADIVEWRADFYEDLCDTAAVLAQCARMKQEAGKVPLLFTVRGVREGGRAEMSPEGYVKLLSAVIDAHAADIVDVEFSIGAQVFDELARRAHASGVEVLASQHVLNATPSAAEMCQRLAAMQAAGADIVKLATMATTVQDAMRLAAAASSFSHSDGAVPTCALAMGADGALTRVLGQAFGSALTFASLGDQSAPGQLTLPQTRAFVDKMDESLVQGRFSELAAIGLLDPDCRLVALLGAPVGHSLSPAIHNLSLADAGIDAFYVAAECTVDRLPAALDAFAKNPAWVGCNVTMPCKQEVIRHLDGLDDAAALSGAVNTIAKVNGKLRGYNTDGVGFVESLRQAGVDVAGKKVCILGGGGAARAVAVQCALDGAAGICLAVRVSSARLAASKSLLSSLATEASCSCALADYDDAAQMHAALGACDILVNATPVGMGADASAMPIDARLLHPGMVVADLVYYPQDTNLIKAARLQGCTTISGLGMLLAQAAASERIWFDVDMNMQNVVEGLFS